MDDVVTKRARNAQHMRHYRKRKRLQTAEKESLIPKKVPKPGAERIREYKLRKQQLLQANASTSVAGNSTDVSTRNTKPRYEKATDCFEKHFINNRSGYSCNVCDRLWFDQDLNQVTNNHLDILVRGFVDEDVSQFKVCATCRLSLNKQLNKQLILALSKSNGFVYSPYPTDLSNSFIHNLNIRRIYVKTYGTEVPRSIF
jgi:hypothetical protein